MNIFAWNPLKQVIEIFGVERIDGRIYDAIYEHSQKKNATPLTTKKFVKIMKKKFSIAIEKTLSTIQNMQKHNRDGALIEVTEEGVITPTDKFY